MAGHSMLFPEPPEVDPAQRASAPTFLRYEDVCQDGRVLILGLPHSLGVAVWQQILRRHPITEMARDHGIIPILTRMVLSGEPNRTTVDRPVEARGSFQLAHAGSPDAPERLFFNAWVDLRASVRDGSEPPRVGRVFAEHVFTRLFAPPGKRKVVALEHPALPAVPPASYTWRDPGDILTLPDGARWIDEKLAVTGTISFALTHTDSNQHVNSLAYLALFEHQALQHIAALGRSTVLLSRHAEITYRKPCFAGDHQAIALRCFEHGDRIGAAGCFLDPSDAARLDAAPPRARCFVRIWFEA